MTERVKKIKSLRENLTALPKQPLHEAKVVMVERGVVRDIPIMTPYRVTHRSRVAEVLLVQPGITVFTPAAGGL